MTDNTRPLIPVHFTDEELAAELEELLNTPIDDEPKNKDKKVILSSIDAVAADNGSKKTQDQWFDYWSGIKDGRVMASMGDLYHYFKSLKQQSDKGQKAAVKTALDSLRSDFDWPGKQNWLISSTRIFYQATNEDAKIVQHYRCNKPNLIKETRLQIPVYLGVPIVDVSRDSHGLKYLQTLHDTNDPAETLIQTFEFVSDKKRADVKVWTPPLTHQTYATRQSHPERAAGFYFNVDGFLVLGNFILSSGCSRGVR